MKQLIFLLAGILLCPSLYAQIHIEGVTIEPGKIALPYVNIGIRHKNIGTVSSLSGTFSIDIPKQNADDTLTFSMVGYEEVNICLANINTMQKEFVLRPANVRLSEFTVSAKRSSEKKYGLHSSRPILHFLDASVDQTDIFEIAHVIKLGKSRAKITSINLLINEPRKDSGTFRINFYRYDGSRPAERIVEKSIVQIHAIKEGWLHFDISKYNIYLTGQIVAAIEFIPGEKKAHKIVYEIKPGGRIKSFVRTSSLGLWQVPPHQYRMYVTALTTDYVHEEEEQEIPPAFSLYSQNVNDSFFIYVRLPAGYKKDAAKRYSTIYVTDANLYFSYLSDTIGKLPPGQQPILIGIGYRNFMEMDSLRDRDYTYPAASLFDSLRISGGGELFYDFIGKELIPLVDRQYRTDTNNRSLMGHSLGGFFTLYALYRDISAGPQLFKNYVAASPSVEYHDQYLARQFEKIDKDNPIPRCTVLITMGGIEGMEMEHGTLYSDFISSFLASLSEPKFKNIQVQKEFYPGAGHMETAIPSLYLGVHKVVTTD